MHRWKLIVAAILAYLPTVVIIHYVPNGYITAALPVVLLVLIPVPLLALALAQDDGYEVAERRRNEQ